jgi:hypothetical protein
MEFKMVKDIAANLAKKLREGYDESETGRKIMDWAAGRQKDAKVTTVDRIAYKADVPRHEVIKVARILEEWGCCEFIAGRHGHSSRVKWLYSLRSLGEAARGDIDVVKQIDVNASEEEEETEGVEAAIDNDLISHKFQLRAGSAITLNLPPDLTEKEAQRLAAFIQSLPFGD